jgi:hypothetical protein
MASLWQKIRNVFVKPKETITERVTTPEVRTITNTDTGASAVVTPSKTTTTYSGSSSGRTSGGGGSSSSSGSYQGPVPQGATPAQEQEFRETGSISTPVTPTQSTSATQVQQRTIDPRTGKMVGELTIAPTFKEKYQATIQEQGKVRGTLAFAGTQFQELISRGQTKAYKAGDTSAYYQSDSILRVAKFAPQASYFVPVVGPSLLIAGGAEEVGTKAGRTRITEGAKMMEEAYGVPKGVGKVGLYSANIASIGIGGLALKGDITRLVPTKTNTLFLGTQQKVTGLQGQPKVITDIKFRTTKTSFFGKSDQVGVSRTATDILKTKEGGFQVGESLTFGVARKTAVSPLGKITTYGKPTQFNIISRSVSGPSKIGQVEVTKAVSVGRGVAGRNIIKAPTKGVRFEFGSGSIAGGTQPIAVKGVSFGRVAGKETLKPSTFGGLIFKPQTATFTRGSSVVSRSSTPSQFTNILQQSQTTAMQSTAGFTSLVNPAGTSIRAVPFTMQQQVPTINVQQVKQTPSTFQITTPKVETTQRQVPNVVTIPRTSTRGRTIQTPNVVTIPRTEQTPRVTQTPIITPRTDVTPRSSLRGLVPTGTGSFIPPTAPVFPFAFPLPKMGTDGMGGLGRIKASRTYRYTPSFGALALKGQAFKVGALSTKKFTGLEFRGSTEKSKSTKSKRRKK